MEKLGHFPMSENPVQFRQYIAPVLDQIRQVGGAMKRSDRMSGFRATKLGHDDPAINSAVILRV